ncbi:c-type cytochrome [Peristeroidobacter agariperforans]|uniref:c-type cytochrome n=1 Tax=Peristeroidobacter agariperforans TaxID=268404 RepID=UPI00101C1127|nr:c-type cytochrome [Peristeroidobacter agariperforans]
MSRLLYTLVATTLVVAPGLTWAASPPGAASCLGCHTVAAEGGPVPALGSFTAEQMVTAMQAFRSGSRPATVMNRIAKGFSDEEIKAIADWYARSKSK